MCKIKHYIVEKRVTKLFGQLITFLRLGRTNRTIMMGDGMVKGNMVCNIKESKTNHHP
jgi:hypothetical protein